MANPILLIGYFGFDNLGDDLILYAFLQRFQKFYPRFILATKKKYTIPVKQIQRWNILLILFFIIFKKTTIVYPGGEIFQKQTSHLSLLYYSIFPFIARIFHRKVLLCFQGQVQNKLAQSVFMKADYLSVRDVLSVPDIVYSLSTEEINNNSDSLFLFALTTLDKDNFILLKSVIVDFMVQYPNLPFYFIPMHRKKDASVNQKMVKLLNTKQAIYFDWKGDCKKALRLFKNALFVFSMRYHSSVLSSLFQKSFISVSSSVKLNQFHNHWNLENIIRMKKRMDFFEIKNVMEKAMNTQQKNLPILKAHIEKEFQTIDSLLKG